MPDATAPANLVVITPESLRALVRDAVAEGLAQLDRPPVLNGGGDRLAYSEEQAAELLGLRVHQLRDERRRKKISASAIVGRRIRYQRQDLEKYLRDRQIR
jgi:hypothetical protein